MSDCAVWCRCVRPERASGAVGRLARRVLCGCVLRRSFARAFASTAGVAMLSLTSAGRHPRKPNRASSLVTDARRLRDFGRAEIEPMALDGVLRTRLRPPRLPATRVERQHLLHGPPPDLRLESAREDLSPLLIALPRRGSSDPLCPERAARAPGSDGAAFKLHAGSTPTWGAGGPSQGLRPTPSRSAEHVVAVALRPGGALRGV
jgi:hypothetical protein